MSTPQAPAPERCPRCEAPSPFYVANDQRLTCKICGHKLPLTEPARVELPADPPVKRWQITYGVIFAGPLDVWTRTKYDSGLMYVQRGDYASAIRSFQQAVDSQPDFIDAHVWLARLADDPDVKRDHYGTVLAHAGNHVEAIRELMVLNGQLSRDEADRSISSTPETVLRPAAPVESSAAEVVCPRCGGSIVSGPEGMPAHCAYCGHELPQTQGGSGLESLTMAMLKRRGQPLRWDVGERLLGCRNCGAERVLGAQVLASSCPFCGSRQVVQRDALDTFQQPDGVVAFRIERDEAQAAVRQALNSRVERFKGFFVRNRVRRAMTNDIFLPFWFFDITLEVRRTIQVKGAYMAINKRDAMKAAMRTEQINEMANDEGIAAVTSPPRDLLERLLPFDLERVQPYDPALLADRAAELYTIDFERASLKAREKVSRRMREFYGVSSEPFADEQITVMPLVQQMSFRLLLLPFWVAVLEEEDGDLRTGLVHGQTGKVVLGPARKPD